MDFGLLLDLAFPNLVFHSVFTPCLGKWGIEGGGGEGGGGGGAGVNGPRSQRTFVKSSAFLFLPDVCVPKECIVRHSQF